MKKYTSLFAILSILACSAHAAQQPITTITSGTGKTGKTLKAYNDDDITPRLADIDENFTDLYTNKEPAVHIGETAPADTTKLFLDSNEEAGVLVQKKYVTGTGWVRVGSHGVQYATSCASINGGMCVDAAGKLWYHNGTAVVEVGSGGSVSSWSDIQALLTGTGDYVKADGSRGTPSGTLPTGTATHDTLEWDDATSAWKPITPVELTDGTGIDIVNGVVSVTANTYQPLDSDLITAAGAGTAGNSKYFGTNSSGSAGFHDLPTGGGSFVFDTFPAYEDSAHSSGIAVNGTTLAVYSSTAGKWLTAALSDTLDAAPATYILTLDGSDWNGTDSVTVGASTLTADGTFTGLSSANTAVTCTPDTGRTCVCTGAEVTGTAPDYVVDMSDSNESMACTFADVVAGLSVSDSFTYSDGDLNNVANWDKVTGRGSLLIVSGKISGWADDWQSSIWKASDAFAANQEACLSVDTLGNKMGIGVRASSTEFTGYYLAAAADGTYLFRYNNGTRTDIVSYAAITAGQTICLRVSGTTLTAKINGVDQVSQTDATISTGNPSVISYGTVGRGDNFTARDL